MHGLLSAEDAAEWVKDNKGSRAGPLTPSKPAAASRAAGAKRPAGGQQLLQDIQRCPTL
jgi:hypothetical protein